MSSCKIISIIIIYLRLFIEATKYIRYSKISNIKEINKIFTTFIFEFKDNKKTLNSKMIKQDNELGDIEEKDIICSICEKVVNEIALLCPICYHGGHFSEMYNM